MSPLLLFLLISWPISGIVAAVFHEIHEVKRRNCYQLHPSHLFAEDLIFPMILGGLGGWITAIVLSGVVIFGYIAKTKWVQKILKYRIY